MSDIDTVREGLKKMKEDTHDLMVKRDCGFLLTALQSIEEENKRLREATEWRDIASAPRDGTNFLLCVPGEELGYKTGSKARCIGYYAQKYTLPMSDDVYEPEKYPNAFEYQESSGEWFAAEGFYTDTFENQYGDEVAKHVNPTHWLPLPTPPQSQEKTDDE